MSLVEERPPSLLHDLRENYGGEYRLASLWQDRRRILDDPSSAAQPRRGLVNSPVRFAMTLGVVPLLLAGWLMAQLAGLLAPDRPTLQNAAADVAQVLTERLRDLPPDTVRDLRQQFRTLPADVRALREDGRKAMLGLSDSGSERDAAIAAMRAWLARVDAAPITDAQRNSVIARLAHEAQVRAQVATLSESIMASMLQGGTAADILFALSYLLSAWLFKQMLRGDARFVHADHAERFFLYYITARLFWWLLLFVPVFGALSYAHASGQIELMNTINIVETVLALASTVYLLTCSREMASALSGGAADRSAAWSVSWRLIAAMAVSWVLLMVIVAFAIGGSLLAYTVWLSH